VADDVVEVPVGLVHVENAGVLEGDVLEAELLDELLAVVDLAGGQVDADELAIREVVGHRDQVAAGGAAEFQHPATLHGGRPHPEEGADDEQPARVGLGERVALVGDLVVAVDRGGSRVGGRDVGQHVGHGASSAGVPAG